MENTSENPAVAPEPVSDSVADPGPETIPAPAATHHPRVLWAVVASTMVSILSVCFLLKKLLEAVDWTEMAALLTVLFFIYMLILGRIWGKGAKKGLRLATGWGVNLILLSLIAVYLGSPKAALFAAAQVAMVASALHAYRGMKLGSPITLLTSGTLRGFGALIFVALTALPIPNLFADRVRRNELQAEAALEKIHQAQETYASQHSPKYAASLAELGPEPGAAFIDEHLAQGSSRGYRITLAARPAEKAEEEFSKAGYTLHARPLTYKKTGSESYFMDESGVICYTDEDRPATVNDPPVGG